jgi:hypothetical protein
MGAGARKNLPKSAQNLEKESRLKHRNHHLAALSKEKARRGNRPGSLTLLEDIFLYLGPVTLSTDQKLHFASFFALHFTLVGNGACSQPSAIARTWKRAPFAPLLHPIRLRDCSDSAII